MLLLRCVKLRRRCSKQNSNLYWTSVPRWDALIVLGEFNAVNGTERACYLICVGPHGSGSTNDNSSFLTNLARSKGLRIAFSWYHRPVLHCWICYNNVGGEGKIQHILVSTFWRILQKCRIFWGAPSSVQLIIGLLFLFSSFMSKKASKLWPHRVSSWETDGLDICPKVCGDNLQSIWSARYPWGPGRGIGYLQTWDSLCCQVMFWKEPKVKEWLRLNGDTEQYWGESHCQTCWELWPEQDCDVRLELSRIGTRRGMSGVLLKMSSAVQKQMTSDLPIEPWTNSTPCLHPRKVLSK